MEVTDSAPGPSRPPAGQRPRPDPTTLRTPATILPRHAPPPRPIPQRVLTDFIPRESVDDDSDEVEDDSIGDAE
jgi:hypothetical protein